MPLELLASIKGASSSEAVNELFEVIRSAVPEEERTGKLKDAEMGDSVSVENLRSDEVQTSSDREKEIIRRNFPVEKNGFLVVPKVIED